MIVRHHTMMKKLSCLLIFIENFKGEWEELKFKLGESMARQKIKDGFIAKDEKNLLNIEPGDEVH